MRIVIDMQGAQTRSRYDNVGASTMGLAKAIVCNNAENEVILVLSNLFPDTVEPIRAAFNGIIPQQNIRVWEAPKPVSKNDSNNEERRLRAELIRESFIANMNPDIVHVCSPFEGYMDDGVVSIGSIDSRTPITVSIFELPPTEQINDEAAASWYEQKIEDLGRAEACYLGPQAGMDRLASKLPVHSVRKMIHDPISEADALAFQLLADWAAINESMNSRDVKPGLHEMQTPSLPRLAYVSPVPPERTGIADYSAELLPALAHYYDIDLVVDQDKVDKHALGRKFPIRDADWLRGNADQVDRILYHVGNSPFHAHMLPLINDLPGVVVLHDFFLGHLWRWLDHFTRSGTWERELYENHGYSALRDAHKDPEESTLKYPCSFSVFRNSPGIIVHSEYSRKLAAQWYGEDVEMDWSVIPLLRAPAIIKNRKRSIKRLGFKETDFIVCSFGFLGPTKLNHRLLESWVTSSLSQNENCHLVFVGEKPAGEYGNHLDDIISRSGLSERIHITGFVSGETYSQYLLSASAAVQLRTLSRGETSAAVMDCMNYALPLIVNANGSMGELDNAAVHVLPDEFEDKDLVSALEELFENADLRQSMGDKARGIILHRHSPEKCAERYSDAIERFYRQNKFDSRFLLNAIGENVRFGSDELEQLQLASAVASSFPAAKPAKRLFLDVTATARNDLKTGIERVARALALELLESPIEGYRVEPVYLSEEGGAWHYRYAREFTLSLLQCPAATLTDDVADPQNGDVILGLDLAGDILVRAGMAGLLQSLRNQGVSIYFTVFDLLPVRMPEVFPPGADNSHAKWLETVSSSDGAICISKAVADDLAKWQDGAIRISKEVADNLAEWKKEAKIKPRDSRPFSIGWVHLGANISRSSPSQGLPEDATEVLGHIRSRPSFLMVGTIEPRKGYLQTLQAFTRLWDSGVEANLVIIGSEGWKGIPDDKMRRSIPEIIEQLRHHPQTGNKLFWLEGVSDEYLELLYNACSCLIAASYDEGFGLPLIESAQNGLPILARDIPVFREVAGEYACYFQGREPEALSSAVLDWLQLYAEDRHPKSNDLPWITWQESAKGVLRQIFNPEDWLKH